MLMALVGLIVSLIIVGIIWWGANEVLKIINPYLAPPIQTLIRIVVIVIICVILIVVLIEVTQIAGITRLPLFR